MCIRDSLVSDSTGETLDRIFLALKAQFINFEYNNHQFSFTRTENQVQKIIEIAQQDTAVLMVEQNAKQALEISDLGFVLNQGKNLYTDTGKALLSNKEVRQAFLGG